MVISFFISDSRTTGFNANLLSGFMSILPYLLTTSGFIYSGVTTFTSHALATLTPFSLP